MGHELPFGTFHPEKQYDSFWCSVAPWKFPLERPQKGVFHLLSNRIFQKHFVNGKQPQKALSLTTIRYKKDVEDSEEEGGGGGGTFF